MHREHKINSSPIGLLVLNQCSLCSRRAKVEAGLEKGCLICELCKPQVPGGIMNKRANGATGNQASINSILRGIIWTHKDSPEALPGMHRHQESTLMVKTLWHRRTIRLTPEMAPSRTLHGKQWAEALEQPQQVGVRSGRKIEEVIHYNWVSQCRRVTRLASHRLLATTKLHSRPGPR